MLIEVKDTTYLWLYRSIFFKIFKFTTKNKKLNKVVKALNIKSRKKRIIYIYQELSKEIDKYYSMDLCDFKDNKCVAQRQNKSKHINGCCRMCLHRTGGKCPTNNIACKMFYCDVALTNAKKLEYNDLALFKVFSIANQFMVKSDYFTKEEEIINDLYYGILISTVRVTYRFIKQIIYYKLGKKT